MGEVILPSEGDVVDEMNGNDYRMAIVADIFTDPMSGTVLTLGTGIPHRIYMTIYDPPGGRRVCVGYTYSYYEFYHPQDERLNDDEWKIKVYDENGVSLQNKEPEWIKNMRYE